MKGKYRIWLSLLAVLIGAIAMIIPRIVVANHGVHLKCPRRWWISLWYKNTAPFKDEHRYIVAAGIQNCGILHLDSRRRVYAPYAVDFHW